MTAQIPVKIRLVLYVALGVANAGVVALTTAGVGDKQVVLAAGTFIAGLSALFFGVAGSNARDTAAPENVVAPLVITNSSTPEASFGDDDILGKA